MRFAIYTTYYAEEKAALLRDCLVPLASRLAAARDVEHAYLERHWLHGPHVRVVVAARDEGARARVAGQLGDIEAFLARRPSRRELAEAAYLALSERLGHEELVPPPYGPLSPDNHVEIRAHAPRLELYGNLHALAFVERRHTAALLPVAAFLAATAAVPERRLTYALSVLALAAASYPLGGLFLGQLSLRSHTEEFLHLRDRDGRLAGHFAERYQGNRARIVPLVEATCRNVVSGHYRGDDPVLRAFATWLDDGLRDGLRLARDKHIGDEPGAQLRQVARGVSARAEASWAFDDTRSYSPFHQELRGFDQLTERQNTVEFSAFRWVMNLLYVVLPLLDVSPLERLFLGHAVAEASESLYGTTWRQHFQTAREQIAARPRRRVWGRS